MLHFIATIKQTFYPTQLSLLQAFGIDYSGSLYLPRKNGIAHSTAKIEKLGPKEVFLKPPPSYLVMVMSIGDLI